MHENIFTSYTLSIQNTNARHDLAFMSFQASCKVLFCINVNL